ncbi:MAG: type II toxin-antitoxin system RelE family toxin [Spirulinaceae cyanobacterium]
MSYTIQITEDAKQDLSYFKANEKKQIISAIKSQLIYEPLIETRNRKRLRENPIATWELRSGKFRIFYEVIEEIITVTVISIGIKQHNTLYIRGNEVKL